MLRFSRLVLLLFALALLLPGLARPMQGDVLLVPLCGAGHGAAKGILLTGTHDCCKLHHGAIGLPLAWGDTTFAAFRTALVVMPTPVQQLQTRLRPRARDPPQEWTLLV